MADIDEHLERIDWGTQQDDGSVLLSPAWEVFILAVSIISVLNLLQLWIIGRFKCIVMCCHVTDFCPTAVVWPQNVPLLRDLCPRKWIYSLSALTDRSEWAELLPAPVWFRLSTDHYWWCCSLCVRLGFTFQESASRTGLLGEPLRLLKCESLLILIRHPEA